MTKLTFLSGEAIRRMPPAQWSPDDMEGLDL